MGFLHIWNTLPSTLHLLELTSAVWRGNQANCIHSCVYRLTIYITIYLYLVCHVITGVGVCPENRYDQMRRTTTVIMVGISSGLHATQITGQVTEWFEC